MTKLSYISTPLVASSAKSVREMQLTLIISAIHDYNVRTNRYDIGLTFPRSTDFNSFKHINELGLCGPENSLNDILTAELASASECLISFSVIKYFEEETIYASFNIKKGVGLNGARKTLVKRAKDKVRHVKEKFGQDIDFNQTLNGMLEKATKLEKSDKYLASSIHSTTHQCKIKLNIYHIPQSTGTSETKQRLNLNIYGLKALVPLF